MAAQIATLQATIGALQRGVATNTADIDTLENQTAASEITLYSGIIGLAGGRTAGNRANAKSVSHLQPLVIADFNNPSGREEKTITSLLLSGALLQFNASATVGYYSPWIAIKDSDIGSNTLVILGPGGDESSLWRPAGTAVLNSATYNLYVRVAPLLNGKTLKVLAKAYE